MHGEPATGGLIVPGTAPVLGETGCALVWPNPTPTAPTTLTVNITGSVVPEQRIRAALRGAVLDYRGRNGQSQRS